MNLRPLEARGVAVRKSIHAGLSSLMNPWEGWKQLNIVNDGRNRLRKSLLEDSHLVNGARAGRVKWRKEMKGKGQRSVSGCFELAVSVRQTKLRGFHFEWQQRF